MKLERKHDELYLKEDYKAKPKEVFKFVLEKASPFISKIQNPVILDIGCATGEFLYYVKRNFPNAQLHGMDVMAQLIEKAKRDIPDAEFRIGNIYAGENLPDQKFDLVFLLGVHSIFDTIEPWIDNLLSLAKPNSRIYVFGIFNPYDVDVLLKVKRSGSDESSWEPGWNVISQKTIGEYLKKKGKSYNFTEFDISIDVPVHENDPLRAWTFKNESGKRLHTSGIRILYDFSLLEIIT